MANADFKSTIINYYIINNPHGQISISVHFERPFLHCSFWPDPKFYKCLSFLGPIQQDPCANFKSVICLIGISGLQSHVCITTLPCHLS